MFVCRFILIFVGMMKVSGVLGLLFVLGVMIESYGFGFSGIKVCEFSGCCLSSV